jgi:hypothetical protein
MRWIAVPERHSSRAVPCPACADNYAHCGLNGSERTKTFEDIIDLPGDTQGKHAALKWAGQRLLDLGYGFASLYGNYGTAKTLFGQIVVAEACRRRLRAKYILGKELERKLFDRDEHNQMESSASVFEMVNRYPVLCVDECHMMNWKNDWVAGELMRLIEDRHRGAVDQKMITILIGQTHPSRWGPAHNVGALMSRTVDGRFGLPWGDDDPPPCLTERPCPICGAVMRRDLKIVVCSSCGTSRYVEMYWPFALDLPDVRPILPPLSEAEQFNDDVASAYAA